MAFPIHAILCAIDFSPFCARVCDYGVALARRAGVRLYLLHAVHHPQDRIHPTLVFERGGDLKHLMAEARRRMQHLMEPVSVDWQPVVRFGDPVEQIAALVDMLPPCLVVSASHGVSGLRRFFIGTVVERMSRTMDRPHAGGQNRPLAMGATRRSVFAVWWSAATATGTGTGRHDCYPLLQPETHMADSSGPRHGRAHGHAPGGPAPRHLMPRPSEPCRIIWIINCVGRPAGCSLRKSDFPPRLPRGIRRIWCYGSPRERGADLIVVGVRPSGAMGRLISGSTTEVLLRHGPCSVLTVPEPKDANNSAGGER